jgi:Holliday junction resolvase RusA-like endonuclease
VRSAHMGRRRARSVGLRVTVVLFTVFGTAAPAGSKTRATAIGADGAAKSWTRDSSKASYPWKAAVRAAAAEAMNGSGLLDGPLSLQLFFHRPRPKTHFGTGRNAGVVKPSAPERPTTQPDLLKTARAIEDALTGIVYRDDAQIVHEILTKHFGEPARVNVVVAPLDDSPLVLIPTRDGGLRVP